MLEDFKLKLNKYNQNHLLNFCDELNDEEKNHLLKQISLIDFELMNELKNKINNKKEINSISSMSSYNTSEEYINMGLESIKNGEYAIITMAGGQGTRLGFDGPKGTYKLKYNINKSLFEIQCDKLKNIYRMSRVYIPWYIMTSYANNEDTIRFFDANNYFNYPKEKIIFFIQDELPMIDETGKILMDSKYNIKMGANGSGGVFSALFKNNILDKLYEDNIKWIFIGGIDNVLLPIDNPDLIGFSIVNNYKVASKIILKAYPEEKVGVFGLINGKPGVIEYLDMTSEMNNLKDKEGNLVYKDSHILCNLFHIDILKKISNNNLEYKVAFKKANHIDDMGNLIISDKENAYKFETFIFDAFEYVDNVGLLRANRSDVFAPIKNATGVDSPETASKLYIDFFNR